MPAPTWNNLKSKKKKSHYCKKMLKTTSFCNLLSYSLLKLELFMKIFGYCVIVIKLFLSNLRIPYSILNVSDKNYNKKKKKSLKNSLLK